MLLSAHTPSGLDADVQRLAAHGAAHPEHALADLAFRLYGGREGLPHRRAVVVSGHQDALSALNDPRRWAEGVASLPPPRVVFLFPGQGAQYVRMGASLYDGAPVFRAAADRCRACLRPHMDRDIGDVLFAAEGDRGTAARTLDEVRYTQPALFMVEYALAELYASFGIRPDLMVGHSVGEFVCAVLSGVMSLEEAARFVAVRGRLVQSLPPGAMLAVRLRADAMQARLSDPALGIAADNGPRACVVAGPVPNIEQLERHLAADSIVHKRLSSSHAFHSPMMAAAVEALADLARSMTLRAPGTPFVSTVTGAHITGANAQDPMYWATHHEKPVCYRQAVQRVWQAPHVILLEVGPRGTLATLARQLRTDMDKQVALASLGETHEGGAEWNGLLRSLGELWVRGVEVDASRYLQTVADPAVQGTAACVV